MTDDGYQPSRSVHGADEVPDLGTHGVKSPAGLDQVGSSKPLVAGMATRNPSSSFMGLTAPGKFLSAGFCPANTTPLFLSRARRAIR